MQIGELAERTGLSLRTIRHYDEVGLLRPSGRSEGGFRLYTAVDLERLLLIRRMKPLGFSIDEMTELLGVVDTLAARADAGAGERDADAMRARLDEFIRDAETRRAKLAEHLAMADEFVGLLRAQ
nr:MerR family transcriptional regulator [Frigoribacterium faeni]